MTSEYQVEAGIPKPPRKSVGGRPTKYPWNMEISDSFFVPAGEGEPLNRLQIRVSGACSAWRQRHGGRYSTRQMDGGVRVWQDE